MARAQPQSPLMQGCGVLFFDIYQLIAVFISLPAMLFVLRYLTDRRSSSLALVFLDIFQVSPCFKYNNIQLSLSNDAHLLATILG